MPRIGQPNLNAGIVKGLPIDLPPFPEQQKIADILSGIENLLRAKISRIKKRRLMMQVVVQEATKANYGEGTIPLKNIGNWRGGELHQNQFLVIGMEKFLGFHQKI